jgi:hypothetical protein
MKHTEAIPIPFQSIPIHPTVHPSPSHSWSTTTITTNTINTQRHHTKSRSVTTSITALPSNHSHHSRRRLSLALKLLPGRANGEARRAWRTMVVRAGALVCWWWWNGRRGEGGRARQRTNNPSLAWCWFLGLFDGGGGGFIFTFLLDHPLSIIHHLCLCSRLRGGFYTCTSRPSGSCDAGVHLSVCK